MTPTPPLVRELSEQELLARVFPLLPRGAATLVAPGDDAAVVAAPDGRVVITTDVLVEDRHFRRRWSTGRDVGRRAAVQNLADVAAMGAVPTSVVVSLVVPGDLEVAWVEGLAAGLADECGPVGVGVVGGDLSGGPVVVVAVTAHGDLGGRAPVLRSGARPGDVVAHAGVLGRSAAGLAILQAEEVRGGPVAVAGRDDVVAVAGRDDVVAVAGRDDLVGAYRWPVSPLAAGPAAARAGATAMLDVSDGLLRDAGRLAAASGVVLDLDGVVLAGDVDGLRAVADAVGADPEAWILGGGEDHGLLATFPAGAAVPEPFRVIGRVLAPGAGVGTTADGTTAEGSAAERSAAGEVLVGGRVPRVSAGWDHFGG